MRGEAAEAREVKEGSVGKRAHKRAHRERGEEAREGTKRGEEARERTRGHKERGEEARGYMKYSYDLRQDHNSP